ncbi:hypothetical protein HU200_033806 [Digitaria exilis]|uniref:No apical meristem-associated C-terminal domain-containing protein n=1 Tax=Digitaria exilis TaxID=1010633 RepID=A0A835EN72_9POAL|nr:hypothetical protein HU200_033806 [Digitaria exilis]
MLRFPFPHPQFMVPPATPSNQRTSPLASDSRSPSPANISQHRVTVDVEVEEESRQRMYYTDEEDIRLVSAWLNNSTDPVEGNSKKAARYWEEVAAAYNETTPSDRKRDVKLLKSHWYKTTKKISSFNGCYNQMRDTYMSGRSDDQLMDQALELYRSRYKHHFTYVHWWRVVRDSPKWNAHIAAEGQAKENKESKMLENKSKMMEHRSKMMDKFSEMLHVDTSKMEPWAKQAHLRAVTALSDELFGRDDPALVRIISYK